MRLFTAVFLIAVPCVGAAASVVTPEEAISLVAIVRTGAVKPPFARQEFDDGVTAWTAGRYLSARNHWVRAQAWLVRTLPPETPALEALAELVRVADQLSQPEPAPPLEPASAAAVERPRRRARRPGPDVSKSGDARAVMDRARAAQKAGEIEKAARLMRIASQLPGGESAAERADALERELLQPAR